MYGFVRGQLEENAATEKEQSPGHIKIPDECIRTRPLDDKGLTSARAHEILSMYKAQGEAAKGDQDAGDELFESADEGDQNNDDAIIAALAATTESNHCN